MIKLSEQAAALLKRVQKNKGVPYELAAAEEDVAAALVEAGFAFYSGGYERIMVYKDQHRG